MKPKCTCGCPENGHCPGEQMHGGYKFAARMTRDPNPHHCHTRHCLSPLCCCLNYTPEKE